MLVAICHLTAAAANFQFSLAFLSRTDFGDLTGFRSTTSMDNLAPSDVVSKNILLDVGERVPEKIGGRGRVSEVEGSRGRVAVSRDHREPH